MCVCQETGSIVMILDFNAVPVNVTISPLKSYSPLHYDDDSDIRERWDTITNVEEASIIVQL